MAAMGGAAADTPMGHILATAGNKECVDCGVPTEGDPWSSINLGIVMCMKCSGLHRMLGTHISKVRSVKLDTSVWEDENVVAHMCSIGNKAFNAVWEWNVPPEIIRPQEFPDNDQVRKAFIFAKYQDRAFFRNEVTGMRSVAGGGGGAVPEGYPVGPTSVKHEGSVAKLSGNSKGLKMFGGNKWDVRTLQLSGDGQLKYLKGSDVKGAISLAGATVLLLPDDTYANRPNCFAVQTAETGSGDKDDGRRFDFHCEGSGDVGGAAAVKWVQMLRFALSSRSGGGGGAAAAALPPPSPDCFGPSPGVPACQLGQVVDQLIEHAQQWVETSTLHGPARCRQLGLPNVMGAWHEAVVVLTPWAFYTFEPSDAESNAAEWSKPTCCIPLQAAEVIDSPGLLPTGGAGNAATAGGGAGRADSTNCRLALSFPLGYCAVSLPSAEQAAEFVAKCKEAAQTSQEAAGGKL